MLENTEMFLAFDLNVPIDLLSVTVLGREFQVAEAEQRKARLVNAVLAKGSDNPVVMAERSVRTLVRKPCGYKESARCHSCSFWFKVRRQHSLQV